MSHLQISAAEEGHRLLLAGDLDIASVPALRQAFDLLDRTAQVTLDLSELAFIDSSGLHAIAALARAQNGHGPLIVEGVSPLVARVFEITNLSASTLFDVRLRRDGD